MSFEELFMLILRVVLYACIVIGLQYAIRGIVFKDVNVEYKNAVRPILFWMLSFLVVCIHCYVTTYQNVVTFIEAYNPDPSASSFGVLDYGMVLSECAKEFVSEDDNVFTDFIYGSLISSRMSIISGIAILVMLVMAILSLYANHRYGKNKLVAFFLTSAFLCSVACGALITCSMAFIICFDKNEEYPENTAVLCGVVAFVIVAGVLACCYIKWGAKQLAKVYMMKKIVSLQPTRVQQPIVNANVVGQQPQQDKATKQCPYCGETILAVAKKCKHCGEWLNKEPEKKKVACPVCGEDVDEGIEICPFCNEKINGTESVPQTKECPICSEEIPADATVCPYCNEKVD